MDRATSRLKRSRAGGAARSKADATPVDDASRLDDFDFWLRRSIIIAFVLGSLAHLVITHLNTPRFDSSTLFADAMVLLGLGSAWGIARLPWQRRGRDLFAFVLLYAAVLIAGLIYSTGGPDSPFGPTFLLIAISSGLYHTTRIALLVAIACAGLGFLPLLYASPAPDFLVRQLVLSGGVASTFLFQRLMIPELLRRARAEQRLQDDLRETRRLSDELARANVRLEREALTDALTGLLNHGAIIARADEALARGAHEGTPLSLLFFDLDHFKRINDTHGHRAGDAVLASVGRWTAEALRPGDAIGRYGGEEFLVVLPNTASGAAVRVTDTLRDALRAHPFAAPDGAELAVTISIGVVTCLDGTCSLQELLHAADAALYAAKRGGRDRVCIAPPPTGRADNADPDYDTAVAD